MGKENIILSQKPIEVEIKTVGKLELMADKGMDLYFTDNFITSIPEESRLAGELGSGDEVLVAYVGDYVKMIYGPIDRAKLLIIKK